MANFDFLKTKTEYRAFADAAIAAEQVYKTSPAMCAVGCRKSLELAVKWVYAADNIEMPYRDNLQSLIHEPSFKEALPYDTWKKFPFLIKLGNLSVHTNHSVTASNAIMALRVLFEFIEWIDYCYGADYKERRFDEKQIPTEKVVLDEKKIKEQDCLLQENEKEKQRLYAKIRELSAQLTAEKEKNQQNRTFMPDDPTEYETRKNYIDINLGFVGWVLSGPSKNVWEEYPVENMGGVSGKNGFVDYVLFGKDGRPLAIVEAKRWSKDPNVGKYQAKLYADCLEQNFQVRPMIFLTNGYETYFWDDVGSTPRNVSNVFSEEDLERLMNRRTESHRDLHTIPIDDAITDRVYQKEAIRAVCSEIQRGVRKHLLVMATGTGKTRTVASLVDVLSKGNYVTNVLFLADRTALVTQAKDSFKNYLPRMSLCNLCSNKKEKDARIVFSTYPTILNAIDDTKRPEDVREFTPAHFDLIVIDESHRSIFRKYREIFDYFDAVLVGLTATPKMDVDRNTYEFFELDDNIPTYAYGYQEAVDEGYLVPYYNYEVYTKFLTEGITYDDLSPEDKKRFEDDFVEDDGVVPDFISEVLLNKTVYNIETIDNVLQEVMEKGIRINGGDMLGKTIIFAQNQRHAQLIVERFDKLYPEYHGNFAARVVCTDSYVQSIIDKFKQKDSGLQIAVSVDMLDTGIDVPECVNLVFFKKVRSKTKFWQMIGRGTRLCPTLECNDFRRGEYVGKKYFLIFDYCSNFAYFREHENDAGNGNIRTLSENIFIKRITLAADLQDSEFAADTYQALRNELVQTCRKQIQALNTNLSTVRLHLRYIDTYRKDDALTYISDTAKAELEREIAPLVQMKERDEMAKRFDNFMYGLMIAFAEKKKEYESARRQLCQIASQLEKQISIVMVKAQLSLIKSINTETFWMNADLCTFEHVRCSLRSLMQFLDGPGPKPVVYTMLTDPVIATKLGEPVTPYAFKDYKEKVNRYVNEHKDDVVIQRLIHNIPLTVKDYQELERIFTEDLGSKQEYEQQYGQLGFGLLVRQIAKMDHDAAEKAFSHLINERSLNEKQINFIRQIINYIEVNGYMDSPQVLLDPPFDRPNNVMEIFDMQEITEISQIIASIKKNAEI